MSNYGSWSVKGIDDRARVAAKEKAREKGMTLGDYINDMLLQGHSEAGPRDVESPLQPNTPQTTPLDGLARRIEAVEARSTLAITGIDQSVLGLLARLENSENATSAMAGEIEGMIDELRETHEALQSKVRNIEADDSAQQNLEAMKALEGALGKLATHVYEESSLTQDETSAIKGRMESGFSDLTDRVEGMEVKIETTLSDAAERVEKAVEQAELRSEGTSRHLSERFSAIESTVATKLDKVSDIDGRMKSVETDVSSAIHSMEGTLIRIQERLNRAETTTDAALKGLEQTFESLDKRIDSVAEYASPERAEALRRQFEERFDGLAADLRASIEASRVQLANEIEAAAAGANPELMGRLESTVDTLRQRLTTGEERSNRALEAVSEQVNRISTGLDSRLRSVEEQDMSAVVDVVRDEMARKTDAIEARFEETQARGDAIVETITAQMSTLADRLSERVDTSEKRSADAIGQIGQQVAGAINRIQAKQKVTSDEVEQRLAQADQAQETRLSKALANISDRLSDMQTQTASAVSPVQKAIASLAERLDSVEDFTNPPHAQTNDRSLPDMPTLSASVAPIKDDLGDTSLAPEAFSATLDDFDTPNPEPVQQDDEFELGFDDWDVDEGTVNVDDDYVSADAPAEQDAEPHQYLADIPEDDIDPLDELSGWDDGGDEARETDVFGSDPAWQDTDEPEALAAAPAPQAPSRSNTDDYLARARQAAIAAATEPASGKNALRGRRSAASSTAKPKGATAAAGKKSSKVPLIAAASVLAIATAGAGAYVALRGKQPAQATTFPVETATTLETASTQAAAGAETGESLPGVEYDATAAAAEADIEAELFDAEEEGSAEPTSLAMISPKADATPTSVDPLPVIPARLTLARAAEEGAPVAQYQWGEARLAAKDYTNGSDYIRRAAQQGLPAAQYSLANLHEQGLGVARDPVEARAWTEKAARGGNIKAMHDLGLFFAEGEGGPQSYAGAVEWFRKAADFGVIDSQFNLAMLYESGLGISPSKTEALFWYEVAALSGDASAPASAAAIRATLPAETADQVRQRASTWRASKPVPASNGQFGRQNWQQGNREQVLALQTVLNGLGYDTGKPDGVAGAGTRTAIRAFQADNGLETTGEINDALVKALNQQAQNRT